MKICLLYFSIHLQPEFCGFLLLFAVVLGMEHQASVFTTDLKYPWLYNLGVAFFNDLHGEGTCATMHEEVKEDAFTWELQIELRLPDF